MHEMTELKNKTGLSLKTWYQHFAASPALLMCWRAPEKSAITFRL
jgi:hypothetical protein